MAQCVVSGTLSEADFNDGITAFVKVSNAVGDNWEIVRQETGDAYLRKKCVKTLLAESDTMTTDSMSNFTVSCDDCGDDDNLSAFTEPETTEDCSELLLHSDDKESAIVNCTFEYHVIYSRSFSVPVLYLNAFKASGNLLSLSEMWEYIPSVHKDRLHHERWTFLTQVEHPYLGIPFYYLHPCHTSDLMGCISLSFDKNQSSSVEEVQNNEKGFIEGIDSLDTAVDSVTETVQAKRKEKSAGCGFRYLVAWLSSVGPVVHLNLPMHFAMQL